MIKEKNPLRVNASQTMAAWLQSRFSVPVLLLVLHIFSYGLVISRLGFYWDDWETILITQKFPLSEFWAYFAGTRPLAAWTHILFGALIGVKPIGWHLLSLLLRWLTSVAGWWSLSSLWPTKNWQVTAAMAVFSVYPLFIQQPIAVAYHQHWLAFAFFFVSAGLMLMARKRGGKWQLLHIPGVLACVGHLSILEYFAGLELLRPLLLWYSTDRSLPAKKRLGIVAANWLPYLVIITIFGLWRMNYTITVQSDTNRPDLLLSFFQSPFATLVRSAKLLSQDIIITMVSVWNKTISPSVIDFTSKSYLGTVFIAVISFTLTSIFLILFRKHDQKPGNDDSNWSLQALLISITGIILGFAPIWAMGRQLSLTNQFTDRYGLAAMPWAALLIIVAIEWFQSPRVKQALVIGLLVGAASGYQLQNANSYRWSWIQQQRVYWQLFWRAPAVADHTVFISESDLFQYVKPNYSLNSLYNKPSNPKDMAYSFYLTRDLTDSLAGQSTDYPLESLHRNFQFQGNLKDSLVLFYEPSVSNCLWIINSDDSLDPFLSDTLKQVASVSNLSTILPEPLSNDYPPADIFGTEPLHGWCYLYQKAELARQNEDWTTAVELGNQALDEGYDPNKPGSNAPHEWQPFIEAYAMTGKWDRAIALTQDSLIRDKRYANAFCSLWQGVLEKNPPGEEVILSVTQLLATMHCDLK